MQTEESEVVEYVTTGVAARALGYKDTRSVIRLVELGEISGHRMPSGHWRLERASVLEALTRFERDRKVS